jgi:hypothetical protein
MILFDFYNFPFRFENDSFCMTRYDDIILDERHYEYPDGDEDVRRSNPYTYTDKFNSIIHDKGPAYDIHRLD